MGAYDYAYDGNKDRNILTGPSNSLYSTTHERVCDYFVVDNPSPHTVEFYLGTVYTISYVMLLNGSSSDRPNITVCGQTVQMEPENEITMFECTDYTTDRV